MRQFFQQLTVFVESNLSAISLPELRQALEVGTLAPRWVCSTLLCPALPYKNIGKQSKRCTSFLLQSVPQTCGCGRASAKSSAQTARMALLTLLHTLRCAPGAITPANTARGPTTTSAQLASVTLLYSR